MKRTSLLLIVAALVTGSSVAAADDAEQWLVNGHWYKAVYVPDGINWYDAKEDAEDQGWYLATITLEGENAFIFSLVTDPKFWIWDGTNAAGPWLGGYQPPGSPEPAGNWQWVTGESWDDDKSEWATGEPNNLDGIEDWLHFFAKGSQSAPTWNDFPAEPLMKGYVMEIPEPSTVVLALMGFAWVLKRRGHGGSGS